MIRNDDKYASNPLPGFLGDLLLRVVAGLFIAALWYVLGISSDWFYTAVITMLGTYAIEGIKAMWQKHGDW